MGIASNVLFIAIIAVSPPLWAQDNVADLDRYVHKAASYDEEIVPRKLVETMPRQDQERVAATGQVQCPGGHFASAQVTMKQNLITTVAHLFIKRNTCEVVSDPKRCSFVIIVAGVTRSYPIADVVAQGFKCPVLPKPSDDWAVLRLKSAVTGVDPYLIDEQKIRNLAVGDRVATVGHSMDFHRRYPKGSEILPKHFGTCAVAKLYRRYYPIEHPIFMSAPCGCSQGCSGGSLLTDEPRPALLGIVNQNIETPEQLAQQERTGQPVKLPYGELTGTTQYLLFTDDFLAAVKEAAEATAPYGAPASSSQQHPAPIGPAQTKKEIRDRDFELLPLIPPSQLRSK